MPRHAYSEPLDLETSQPPYSHDSVPTPVARLQTSVPLCLHVVTPTARPSLQTSIPPYHYACSTSPGPETSTPPFPYASRPPDLQASMPPALRTSLYLRVYTPAARVQSARPPDLHRFTFLGPQRDSGAAELQSSIPPRRYTYSAPPDLHTSIRSRRYIYG